MKDTGMGCMTTTGFGWNPRKLNCRAGFCYLFPSFQPHSQTLSLCGGEMWKEVGDWSPKQLLRSVSSILLLNPSFLPNPCPHSMPYHCPFHLLLKHSISSMNTWNFGIPSSRVSSKRTPAHAAKLTWTIFALLFLYLFLLQTSSTQNIWFCNHYSRHRMFYLHAELLSDQIRQFQGKNAFLGGTKSRQVGSQYLVQCLSWLVDTAMLGFGWKTSKMGLVFLEKVSQILCFSRKVRNPAGKNNNNSKCTRKMWWFSVKKKKGFIFRSNFSCCCCTFGGENA